MIMRKASKAVVRMNECKGMDSLIEMWREPEDCMACGKRVASKDSISKKNIFKIHKNSFIYI